MRRMALCSFCAGLLLLLVTSDVSAQKTNLIGGLSAFSAAFMPAFVADQAGYFTQEGLAVKLVFFQSGVQLMQSIIGAVGSTGRATGPHLHWAAQLRRARIDPSALLTLPVGD